MTSTCPERKTYLKSARTDVFFRQPRIRKSQVGEIFLSVLEEDYLLYLPRSHCQKNQSFDTLEKE